LNPTADPVQSGNISHSSSMRTDIKNKFILRANYYLILKIQEKYTIHISPNQKRMIIKAFLLVKKDIPLAVP